MLRIWVFKSSVLKNLFILSKHGMKANIRSTKMANNRHAYNRDVLQSYWTSDGLPLYGSRPTGEKTHTNQQCERLAKIRQVTSNRDDRALQRLVRRMPFATSPVLKQHCLPNRCLSTRTVRNRLKSEGLKSRRVIKRPLLADRHRRSRLAWCLAPFGCNLRTWRKIHWSDESRFLLHVTDGRMRVWRHKDTAYTPRNIQPTVPYSGGSVMVWGCISHDCKLDLVTIQGNLTGDQYIRDVLQPVVVLHFDNHPLTTRPVYMDDNARPHCSRAVTAYLQSKAVTSVPWPAMSPDLNPMEHIWDMLGRRIHARESPVQNIRQLEAALQSGMAAAITTGHPTSNWRDETQG